MRYVSFLIILTGFILGWGQKAPDWKPIAQIPEAYTVYTILQIPWSPNIILTAGHDRYGAWHAGLWRSTDYGNNWRYQFWKGGDWDTFLEMEVDEKDYRIWLMGDLSKRGEESNLYYSLDNGESWQAVDNPGSASAVGVPRSIEVVNQKVYYGVVNDAASEIKLYRYNASNSDPSQWQWETLVTIQNADAISELLGVNNYVYLFVRQDNHKNYLFYRYDDNSGSLKYFSNIPLTYVNTSYYKNSNFYVGGDSAGIARIYKSPDGVNWSKIGEWVSNNQSAMTVEALEFVSDTLIIGLSNTSDSGYLIYKSTDDGKNWHPVFNPKGAETIKSFAMVSSKLWCGTGNTFGDVFEATWNVTTGGNFVYGPTYIFDAENRGSVIYFTTNYDYGELYRLGADGTVDKWATFSDATKAFGLIWVNDTVFVGTDDNNKPVKKSLDNGVNWVSTLNPRGVTEAYAFLNSKSQNRLFLGTGYLGDVFIANYRFEKGGSYVYGPTYVFSVTPHSRLVYFTTNYLNGEIYTVDATNSVTLWQNFADASAAWDITWVEDTVLVSLDGNNLLKKSYDDGKTWHNAFEPRGASQILSIQYTQKRSIYLGTAYFGDVFKSTYAYQLGGNYIYGPTYVYDVDFCGTSGFFTCNYDNGEIWKTDDGGNNWANLTSYLQPWKSAFSLVVFEDNMYVGTDYNGDVYKSTDYGKTWVPTKDLSGASAVLSLLLSTEAKRNKLFAGTGYKGDVFLSDNEVMTLIAPRILPEPRFTSGTSNTVVCRDNGSDGYQFEAAYDSLFNSLVERSPVVSDTFYTFTNLQDGVTYYYRVYGVTCQYASLPSAITYSTQDALPPKFWNEFPQNQSWVNNSKPTIGVYYQDAVGLDTSTVTFTINGKTVNPVIITDTTIYYQPLQDLNEVQYIIKVNGADRLGQASSHQWQFKVDVTPPPTPKLLSPSPDTMTNQRQVAFLWTQVKDVPSGIRHYELVYSPDSLFIQYVSSVKLVDTTYVASLNDTVYYWKVVAVDSAGNMTSSEVRKLEVDATAPATPQLQYPINRTWLSQYVVTFQWSSVQKNINAGVKPGGGTLPSPKTFSIAESQKLTATPVEYIIRIVSDTALVMQDTVARNEYTLIFTHEGRYYWKVKAMDKAGNVSNWSRLEMFGIDLSRPVLDSVTVIRDAYMYFGPFTVEVFAHDNISGVDSAYLNYRVDAENWERAPMAKKGGRFIGIIPQVDSTYHKIYYWIEIKDFAGNTAESDTISFNTYYVTGISGGDELIPDEFKIQKIWPNPTNGQFVVTFSLPGKAPVTLAVYNILGQKLWETERVFKPGYHKLQVPANFSSGLYFIVLKSKYGMDTVNGVVVK